MKLITSNYTGLYHWESGEITLKIAPHTNSEILVNKSTQTTHLLKNGIASRARIAYDLTTTVASL
jgi:hypothetical protein